MVIMPSPLPQSEIDLLLRRGPTSSLSAALSSLRHAVLVDGVPSNTDGISDFRIYIWLILLKTGPLPTDVYIDLVHQGSSPAYSKIRNDTFRTLATDPLFRRKVSENSLTRVLNAVAWKLHDSHEARTNGWMSPPSMSAHGDTMSPRVSVDGSQAGDLKAEPYVGYVQGMNVLAAPFLYAARSEVEAFASFDTLIRNECPGYITPSMSGVHKGLNLVDEVLSICDPKLSQHLRSKGLNASIYAFPSVLTLCACTPPLPEVLILWDFLFAYGIHLNLLCIVAQLVLIRDQILGADRYLYSSLVILC
jgi:cell cycle arrest protein BUB2